MISTGVEASLFFSCGDIWLGFVKGEVVFLVFPCVFVCLHASVCGCLSFLFLCPPPIWTMLKVDI